MKIALVLSRPPGYSETFFTSKISHLKASGVKVELYVDQPDSSFVLCPQKSLPSLNIPAVFVTFLRTFIKNPVRMLRFFSMEFKSGNSMTTAFKNCYSCLHLLNSSSIDWIHFGFSTMAVGRENIAAAIGAKMAISFRGYDISRYPLRHPGVYRNLWAKVHKIHTISDALANKALKLGMPSSIPVSKITPAIDISVFKPAQFAESLHSPLRLTTVARLHWSKGLEYTIEALAILHQKGISFTYTVVGEGPELERLVLAAYQLGIKDKIRFAGKTAHSEVIKYLNETDVYLQYSVQEGFCNAALEAQAMGLLCVVSDAEGLPENVQHGFSGWVVPRRSPQLLADKIIEITNTDNAQLKMIRHQAYSRVEKLFTLEKQAKEFASFYTE